MGAPGLGANDFADIYRSLNLDPDHFKAEKTKTVLLPRSWRELLGRSGGFEKNFPEGALDY